MPRGGKRPGAGRRKRSQMPTVLEKLPPRKQKYVAGVIEGKSRRRAALDAGYSDAVARHPAERIETADVREAFQVLMRRVAPAEKIVQRIAEGLDAVEVRTAVSEGKITDSKEFTDYEQRRKYAELAAELGGYHDPKTPMPKPPDPSVGLIYRALGTRTTTTLRQTQITEVTHTQEQGGEVVAEIPAPPRQPKAPDFVVNFDEVQDY